jgi:transcriptional regulator with XRE-family HTH domain
MDMELTERVRLELARLHREKRFSQRRIADTLNVDAALVSRTIHTSERPITLRFLEAVSAAAGIAVTELVAEPGSTLCALTREEYALLRALRRWPASVTKLISEFVAFFADEPASAGQTRNLHQLWREMNQHQRDRVYAVAQLEIEGLLQPDTLSSLERQMSAMARFLPPEQQTRR